MPILMSGASIFTTIFTIITLFLFWKGEFASKNRTKKDNPTCLMCTLIVFMVLQLSAMIAYNIVDFSTHETFDKSFDGLRNETSVKIEKAKKLLPLQDYFSILKTSSENIENEHIGNTITTMKEKLSWKALTDIDSTYDKAYSDTELKDKPFREWLNWVILMEATNWCRLEKGQTEGSVHVPMDRPKKVKSLKETISTNVSGVFPTFERLKAILTNQIIEQHMIAKNATEACLQTIPDIYEHFQTGLNHLEIARDEWSWNTSSSFFRARVNVRIIFNVTFLVLMVSTILSILAVAQQKFLGAKMPVRIALITFYTTGALSLSIGIVTTLMSFRMIGSVCPLTKNNFGLSNFTKPFSLPTGSVLSVCENVGSTVFSGLEAISFDINVNRSIVKHRETIMNLITGLKIAMPPEFKQEFDAFGNANQVIRGKFSNCWKDNSKYDHYCNALEHFINTGRKLIELVNWFNTQNENLFSSAVDEHNKKTITAFKESTNDIKAKYDAIDVTCQPIVTSFIDIMISSTCEQYNVENFLIPLICALAACMISLILHIIVHGNVKNDGELSSTTQSPLSTTTINTKSVTSK